MAEVTRKLLVVECVGDIDVSLVEATRTLKPYSGMLKFHELPTTEDLPADTLRYLRDSLASGEMVIPVHRNDLQLILGMIDERHSKAR